ncbi:hypothetical protein PIROE2DRAFT_16682 [Piromyces sp. E2]|nr:hypothetical protein PIROE2DRAFT_16682 [Piromyces sp. E2]|eukprot:OUM58136.1 hypothetical protein PIROE2DRAFT_16682 [Piromyces sp. E2]
MSPIYVLDISLYQFYFYWLFTDFQKLHLTLGIYWTATVNNTVTFVAFILTFYSIYNYVIRLC